MKLEEIILTQEFGKTLKKLDSEAVKNILFAAHPREFIERVNKLGDTIAEKRVKQEAEVIYNELGFGKCKYIVDCKKVFAEVSPTL